MEDYAIHLENVGKKYKENASRLFNVRDKLLFRKAKKQDRWSIKDVTLSIRKGESVAIIGDNGSGKSTLLRMILGVTSPTTGKVTVNGRIGGLIELGAGFQKELSGRENIYMNGVVLGLTEKEIDQVMDDIIAFSELEHHIDKPIKTFSSGMKVRLGFSIAIHVHSDIVLLDEVLAVGDKHFRKKALQAIRQFLKGKTIVFVSHSAHQVRAVCEKAIVLDQGEVVYFGDVDSALDLYENEIVERKDKEIEEKNNKYRKKDSITT
ncbi:ABC transporter ATP-binding protein [Oceanobacillus senegalensis]|uniref:ABC transporter ATP-binding protein n=1 Tax=Oceanobacillus senegalensis TaxID=1936063 RepID=UPI000A3049BC|nr:ABC transporter ATP-binding protein [Oceanobacillus senegalensis]